jgi:CheY-like chemotaxis protein
MTYVLLVEDYETIRTFIRLNLTQRGFEVTETASGEAALEHIRHQTPLLMLLDLGLPGMSGFDLLNILVNEPELSRIPTIVVSAWGREQVGEIKSAYPQVVEALSKPVAVSRLIDTVRSALTGSHS